MLLVALLLTIGDVEQPHYPHYGGARKVAVLDGSGWEFGFVQTALQRCHLFSTTNSLGCWE
eukprot:gene29340-25229_t